jgi:hypothetical protein
MTAAGFLRRRQAKVPESCLHETKALWRPPDIERETRDEGGDAVRAGRGVPLLIDSRRQAKVPESCLHETKGTCRMGGEHANLGKIVEE